MEERWDGEFGVLTEKLSSRRGDGTLSSYHKTEDSGAPHSDHKQLLVRRLIFTD